MPKFVFTPVCRRKAQGDKPRLGLPDSIQVGDYLTVILNGAFHTRRCMATHRGYVLTEPLRWNGQTLDSSRKVAWDDIEDASRPPEGYQEPVVDPTRPSSEPKPPKPEPPKPKPEPPKPKPAPPKPPEKVPPLPEGLADLWALLGDK